MAKSIKFTDVYIDSSGVHCGDRSLKKFLDNRKTFTMEQRGHNSDYPKYYLLAKLPVTGNSNGATLRINGFMGGYTSDAKAIVDVLISNRGGLAVHGIYIGNTATFNNSRLEIYEQDGGQYWIYFVQAENYTGGVYLDVTGTNLSAVSCKDSRVETSGTLVKTIDANVLTKLA